MKTTYESLLENDDFKKELGRVVLLASKFETVLKSYLLKKGFIQNETQKIPMGGLLKELKNNQFLGCTLEFHLNEMLHQRNYYVHKVYQFLNESFHNDLELKMFENRIKHLAEDLTQFTNIFEKENETDIRANGST